VNLQAAPQVSFVVIAHNERRHGPVTVRSILSQDAVASFEVIFVDDGSTDGTIDAVSAVAAGDPRVRVVGLRENVGRGAARAAGIDQATAPLIASVDADIRLPPNWLRRSLEALPGHAAVGGIAVPDGHSAVLARLSGARPKPIAGSMPVTGANVLMDAAVLRSVGFDPRDRLGEDFRLFSRLVRDGHSLYRVPGLVVEHHESKSYARELRWRFENGVDAAGHLKNAGPRFADAVWAGWLTGWIVAVVGTLLWSPIWLLLGLAVTVSVGIAHTTTRFYPAPVAAFVAACLLDIPLMNANMLGRFAGARRLLKPPTSD